MANMTFKANLIPLTDLGYELGSSDKRWKIYGAIVNGLEITGHIAGDGGTTGHGLWSGGGYHNAYNNIILHGDALTGSSGIAFVSDKVAADGTITTINLPSDRAFIQWHANGVTTYTAESTAPTLATSGENNILVIGVGNDATDLVRILTPGRTGLLHLVGATGYVIPDTNNTTGTVGSTTLPVWISAGAITATTYYLSKSVPSDAVFTDTKQNITLGTTSKAYITGVTTTPTSTALALTGIADTGVYLTATAGEISAVRHSYNISGTEKAYTMYNNTTNAIDFVFV